MKSKIRWIVYSTLALPLIALAIFAASLNPAGRAGLLADLKRNTMNMLTGNFDAAPAFSAKPIARDESGGGWRGSSGLDFDPAAIVARLDKDRDGKLAGDEIGKRLRDHLARLDADENGAITLDEFQIGMQTMYSHRQRRGGANGTRGVVHEATAAEVHADQLFAADRVVEVKISLSDEDWQALCEQSRDSRAAFANPTDKPYSYFKGDITIDGVTIQQVGIRKKGFIGSQDTFRPSLKIKFSEDVDQQPVGGLDRLTLNNNKQDRALLSQYLTYRLFRQAGVHAPRCSFAAVTVNGEYLGVYSNVESIKKPFLSNEFGDGSGRLYEGTLTDFYPKAIDRFEAKTTASEQDRSRLLRLAELLNSGADLDVDEIGNVVDVDNFLKYWAIESLIGFWDGYTQNQNNFFVYDNPQDTRFYFIPWGADSCFSGRRPRFARFGGTSSNVVRARSMLSHRLYHADGIPRRYRSTLLEILTDFWDEEGMLREADRIEKLLFDHLDFSQVSSVLAMDDVRTFIRERRGKIMAELKNDWPVVIAEEPRKPMYTVQVGSAKGSFSTRWNDDGQDASGGTATVSLTLDGRALEFESIKVRAQPAEVRGFGGFGRNRENSTLAASIEFIAARRDDRPITFTLMVSEDSFVGGAGQQVKVSGSLDRRNIVGVIKLDQAGTKSGDAVTGEFEIEIVETHGGFMRRRW